MLVYFYIIFIAILILINPWLFFLAFTLVVVFEYFLMQKPKYRKEKLPIKEIITILVILVISLGLFYVALSKKIERDKRIKYRYLNCLVKTHEEINECDLIEYCKKQSKEMEEVPHDFSE